MLDDLKREASLLTEKILKVGEYLKIEDKKKKIGKLQAESQDPKLWNAPDRAKKLLRDLKGFEKEVSEWENTRSKVEDLCALLEMAKEEDEKELKAEFDELVKAADSLEIRALLGGEYDNNDAILSINSGAGGTDAQDWAQILLRTYTRWAEGKEATGRLLVPLALVLGVILISRDIGLLPKNLVDLFVYNYTRAFPKEAALPGQVGFGIIFGLVSIGLVAFLFFWRERLARGALYLLTVGIVKEG